MYKKQTQDIYVIDLDDSYFTLKVSGLPFYCVVSKKRTSGENTVRRYVGEVG